MELITLIIGVALGYFFKDKINALVAKIRK